MRSINHTVLGQVVSIVLDSIYSNRKEIILELTALMKELKKTQKIKSVESLKVKIEKIKEKKFKAIDRMLEGLLEKSDLDL